VTKHLGWNIITTLCGIDISKVEEQHNDDDDDNDTNIHNETIEASNDNGYHELQPHNTLLAIGHPSKSQITRASQIMMMLQNPNFYLFGYIWMF
jgi:hypothetical protein